MIYKRIILFFLILLVGFSCLSAQSLIQQGNDVVIPKDVLENEEELDTVNYSEQDWFALFNLSGDEYLERLHLLLSHDSSRNKLQPYAFGECLWFNYFIKPFAENNENLIKAEQTVNLFISEIDTGKIIPHEISDTVYSIFKTLVSLSPQQSIENQVPELQIFSADSLFYVPSEQIQSVKMYRALALYQKYFAGTSYGDILNYTDNAALIYVYMNDIYNGNFIPEELNELSLFYKCYMLLNECKYLSVKYGFNLLDIMPDFSKSILKAALENEFILCCISDTDLNQLFVDLTCVKEVAPEYFARLTRLITGGNE